MYFVALNLFLVHSKYFFNTPKCSALFFKKVLNKSGLLLVFLIFAF